MKTNVFCEVGTDYFYYNLDKLELRIVKRINSVSMITCTQVQLWCITMVTLH